MTIAFGEGSTSPSGTTWNAGQPPQSPLPEQDGPSAAAPVPAGALSNPSPRRVARMQTPQMATSPPAEDLELRSPDGPHNIRDAMIAMKLLMELVNKDFMKNANKTIAVKRDEREIQVQKLVNDTLDLLKKMRAAADSLLKHLPGWVMKAAMLVIAAAAAYVAIAAVVASGGLAAAPAVTLMAALISTLLAITTAVYTSGSIAYEVEDRKNPFGIESLNKEYGKIFDDFFQGNLPGMLTDIVAAAGVTDEKVLLAVSIISIVLTVALMIFAYKKAANKMADAMDAEFMEKTFRNCQRVNTVMQITSAEASGAQAGVTYETMTAQIDEVNAQAAVDSSKLLMELAADSLTRLMTYVTQVVGKESNLFESFIRMFDSEAESSREMLA